MLVPGILGFYGLLVVSALVIYLVIREKWRNALARKEEIMRLAAMASEEAAIAEVDASAEHTPVPRLYQCAVCFCPTTTRCSKCKAVHYCSGKCQIIHWRRGHKDACRPRTAATQSNEGSDFCRITASQKQFEIYGNDSEIGRFSSEASSMMDDDDNLNPQGDPRGSHTGFPSSNNSLLAGFTPSNSPSEVLGSSITRGPERPEIPVTGARIKKMEQTAPPPPESTNLVNCAEGTSRSSKLHKMRFGHNDEEIDPKLELPKGKIGTSDDVRPANLDNKKSIKGAASSEVLVTDASKLRSSPSSGRPRSDYVTNDREDESHLFNDKNVRSFSFSVSDDHPSSTTGGHLITRSKSPLPTKVSSIPSLPQNAHNGLKTSMQKVVQQFRASKQSKSQLLGSGNETAGKHNYKIIFPYELFIELYSNDKVELCTFGLTNCGNSCYANAVLQCLAFTRPLTSYLVRGLHSRACRKKGWCFICEFECLILKAREGKSPLSPIGILSRIQKIGSHLGQGREEDAHEFLRYAVDTMQSVCLKEAGATGLLAEETTLVGLTFGGYLRSKIKCMKCHSKSELCERMMDLTVEIDGDIGTLEDALAQFTARETLDGENKYHCSRCKSYEKAKKKLSVLEAPNILTIVLKRFQAGNFGKLSKIVQFPEVLNIAPYMSGTSDRSPVYSLYAVVVHLDVMNAAFSGHYVCYVKNFQGEWFRIDDSTVMRVGLDRVLSEGAYMLLYARHSPRPPALVRNNMVAHGVRSKKRNLEAVPSKTKSKSNVPSIDPFVAQQKLDKYPYRRTLDGRTINHLFDPDDWRFRSMQRIRTMDSSSESSSLFSCSDASSCSSASTKDSARTEDFSDYLFGEMGPSWYSQYGISSDSVASSSHQNFDADTEVENDAWWLPPPSHGLQEDLEGVGNPAILYADSSKHHRNLSTQIISSDRDSDMEQVLWANPFDVKSGISLRRAGGDRSTQTFY